METNKKNKIITQQMIAVPFVKDAKDLENYSNSRAYILKVKCLKGEKLTREEKNWITEKINSSVFYSDSICVMGWKFDFSDYLRKFIYKLKHSTNWYEIMAFDKTSARNCLAYDKRCKMIDVTNL